MSQPLERERTAATRAVRQAARLCRAVQSRGGPATLAKADLSPVTLADFGSQALICRALADAFPDDLIIAEEDADELQRPENAELLAAVHQHVGAVRPGADPADICRWIDHGGRREPAERFWTLDPIDGTKGFLRGEQYAIALALIVDGRLEVAALACPNLPVDPAAAEPGPPGAVFVAVRGRGATVAPLDGAEDDPGVPIRVNPQEDPAAARFCESVESGHSAHGAAAAVAERLGIKTRPVRLDSQAKYAVVARGAAEIYLRLPTRADYREKIWDHAAGALIIAEAGGTVTDIHGRPLEFTHGSELSANRGIVATNGRLHERVLDALSKSERGSGESVL